MNFSYRITNLDLLIWFGHQEQRISLCWLQYMQQFCSRKKKQESLNEQKWDLLVPSFTKATQGFLLRAAACFLGSLVLQHNVGLISSAYSNHCSVSVQTGLFALYSPQSRSPSHCSPSIMAWTSTPALSTLYHPRRGCWIIVAQATLIFWGQWMSSLTSPCAFKAWHSGGVCNVHCLSF